MSEERSRAQVCDDRATLAQLGFQVTSFAYPYGAGTAQVKRVAQACGYNSARDFAGLYQSPRTARAARPGRPCRPSDDFRIRTPGPGTSLADLQRHVLHAEDSRWRLGAARVHQRLRLPRRGGDAISPDDFTAFVRWMTGDRPPRRSRPSTR